MKKTLLFIVSISLFTGCTGNTLDMNKGKKFTFDDKELESKMTYYCVNDNTLGDPEKRAKETHVYFTKENKANVAKFISNAMNGDSKEDSTTAFMLNTQALAKNLHDKFGCVLIDTVEY